jgi:tetratricopeptide (TPR) repeat protein
MEARPSSRTRRGVFLPAGVLALTASCSSLFGERGPAPEPVRAPSGAGLAVRTPDEPAAPAGPAVDSARPAAETAPEVPGLRMVPRYIHPTAADFDRARALGHAVGFLQSGDFGSSAMALQQLRQEGGFGSEVTALHSWVLVQMGEVQAAEDIAREGVGVYGATPALAYAMAVVYELRERPREAFGLYQDLSTLAPDDLVLIEASARTAVAMGDGQEGLRWLDRLMLQQDPGIEQRRLRAAAFEAADRPAEALTIYRQLADEFPQDGELMARMTESGYAAAARSGNRGDWELARDLQRQLTELDPQHAPAFYRLGACERRLGNPMEATTAWQRCLEVEPGHVPAARSLAALLTDIGDREGAARVLLELLRQPLAGEDVDAVQAQLLALEAPSRS